MGIPPPGMIRNPGLYSDQVVDHSGRGGCGATCPDPILITEAKTSHIWICEVLNFDRWRVKTFIAIARGKLSAPA
jgi:hypothetical protein